jgi:hypothetical protein
MTDVGARPLLGALTRARARGYTCAQSTAAAVAACKLLLQGSRARTRTAASLRIESSVDVITSLLAPAAPPDTALLLAAAALLCEVCAGSDTASSIAISRGVLASVVSVLARERGGGGGGSGGAAMPHEEDAGVVETLLALISVLVVNGSGGAMMRGAAVSHETLVTLAVTSLARHGVTRKEVAAAALSTLAGIVSTASAASAVDIGRMLLAQDAFSVIRAVLVAHAAPPDLTRNVISSLTCVVSALRVKVSNRRGISGSSDAGSPLSPPMNVGYASAGVRALVLDGAPKVSVGHLALLVSTLPPSQAHGDVWPANEPPPSVIALWPLPPPALRLGRSLTRVAASLPLWAGAYLPRAGRWPLATQLNAMLSTGESRPDDAAIASLRSAWLDAPHWFPELVDTLALLPERSLAPSAALVQLGRELRESGAATIAAHAAAATASATDDALTANAKACVHPATRLSPPPTDSGTLTHAAVRLASHAVARAIRLAQGIEADSLIPAIPIKSSPSLLALRSHAVLESLGTIDDQISDRISLPRVCIAPCGMKSVRPFILSSCSIPTAFHCATPVGALVGECGAGPASAVSHEANKPLRPADAAALAGASPLSGGYSVDLTESAPAEATLLELLEPVLPARSAPDATVRSLLLRAATRAVALARAAVADSSSDAAVFVPMLIYFRHAEALTNEKRELPPALLLRTTAAEGAGGGEATAVVMRDAKEPAPPLMVPRAFVGPVRAVTIGSAAPLQRPAFAPDFAAVMANLSVAEALNAHPEVLTPSTPRGLSLIDDGALPAAAGGAHDDAEDNDSGSEAGAPEEEEGGGGAAAEGGAGAAPASGTSLPEPAALDDMGDNASAGGGSIDLSIDSASVASAIEVTSNSPGGTEQAPPPLAPSDGAAAVASVWDDAADAATAEAAAPAVAALTFESRFECGNLCGVVRVGPVDYELALDPDTNTGGFSQWFFFRVRGMDCSRTYNFNMINMGKDGSVFLGGMRPWAYFEGGSAPGKAVHVAMGSNAAAPPPAVVPGAGWRRVGHDVTYHRNVYSRVRTRVEPPVFSAEGEDVSESACTSAVGSALPRFSHSFSVNFPDGTHTAWFAYALPYSYSDLRRDCARWEARAALLSAGHAVPITEPLGSDAAHSEAIKWAHAAIDGLDGTLRCPLSSAPLPLSFSVLGAMGYKAAGVPFGASVTFPAPGAPGAGVDAHFSSDVLVRTTLCNSLAGNPVPLLTITDFAAGPRAVSARPYVVLSARVHPGETNASWMMRGLLDVLTSSAPVAIELRRRFVFKIVPMLNPDGVINGSHRTNLAGFDLNREWSDPSPTKAPTILALRAMIMALQARAAGVAAGAENAVIAARNTATASGSESSPEAAASASASSSSDASSAAPPMPSLPQLALPIAAPVVIYIDFHGHSRRLNAFTFGCPDLTPDGVPATPGVLPSSALGATAAGKSNVAGRLFPKLLAARAESFVFSSCGYKITRDKIGAARVAMWRDACMPAVFTLEATFGGPAAGARVGAHASSKSYQDLGMAVALALLDMSEGPEGLRVASAAAALSRKPTVATAASGSRTSTGALNGSESDATFAKPPAAGKKTKKVVKHKASADIDIVIFSGPSRKPAAATAAAAAAVPE